MTFTQVHFPVAYLSCVGATQGKKTFHCLPFCFFLQLDGSNYFRIKQKFQRIRPFFSPRGIILSGASVYGPVVEISLTKQKHWALTVFYKSGCCNNSNMDVGMLSNRFKLLLHINCTSAQPTARKPVSIYLAFVWRNGNRQQSRSRVEVMRKHVAWGKCVEALQLWHNQLSWWCNKTKKNTMQIL